MSQTLTDMINDVNREAESKTPSMKNVEPLDLSLWTIDRFKGEPEELEYLVEALIPLGIAGTVYSMGGVGKSTLVLYLSVLIAIADIIPSKFLEKYAVLTGGKVLYLSAEEPEKMLHRRVRSICVTIAEKTETDFEKLWELCKRNLFVVNLWGTAKQLFDVKSNSLEPTDFYWQIYNTLKGREFKLVVFDTRSRLSGAEGAGNALVSREVGFFEKLAADFGCTALILHHNNKASYGGGTSAAFAIRGESAFLDCLRLGIHLQTISEECAAQNDIDEADRFKYLMLTQSKSNYTAIQEPLILYRDGWDYSLTDIKMKTSRNEQKAKKEAADLEIIVTAITENPGIHHNALVEQFKGRIPMARVRAAIDNAHSLELIRETTGERGKKHLYPIKPNTPPDNNRSVFQTP